jgi:hypothetical protein
LVVNEAYSRDGHGSACVHVESTSAAGTASTAGESGSAGWTSGAAFREAILNG